MRLASVNVSDIEITVPHRDGASWERQGCEDKHLTSMNIMA